MRKVYVSVILIFMVIGILANAKEIFLKPKKSNKIGQNITIENMFKNATESQGHREKAHETWMDKYFNINY